MKSFIRWGFVALALRRPSDSDDSEGSAACDVMRRRRSKDPGAANMRGVAVAEVAPDEAGREDSEALRAKRRASATLTREPLRP